MYNILINVFLFEHVCVKKNTLVKKTQSSIIRQAVIFVYLSVTKSVNDLYEYCVMYITAVN